jgi:catechol 2,3-dioxygenase-like lactoylglutathione lyase family enzyme
MKRSLSLILPFVAVSGLVDAADKSEPQAQVSPADRQPVKNTETFELRIDHVAIGVPDLKATVAWYCEMLGFVPDRKFRMEEVRLSAQIVRRGDFRVEIFQFDEPHPMPASRSDVIGDLRTGGLSHFAFAVPNVAEFVTDVQRRGARVIVPVTEYVPGVPVAFIADNAGNLIELISAVSTQKSGLGGESESLPGVQNPK